MFLNPRYDSDPPFYDDNGRKCSFWLFEKYYDLNGIDNRTEDQDKEIDMIREAAFKGREDLAIIESILRKKYKSEQDE